MSSLKNFQPECQAHMNRNYLLFRKILCKSQVKEETKMPLPSLRPETVTYAGEGFRELRQQPFSTCENQQHGHRIEFNIDWEVHQAMCRYPNSNNFSQICTINGGEIDAQAAACEDYIQEHFAVGKDILYVIQSAWDLGASYEANPIEGDIHHLSVTLYGPEKERAVVRAVGSSAALTDLVQAFSWFCCALRPIPSKRMSLSTFKFNVTTQRGLWMH